MAFLELNFFSESLGTQQKVSVILPQESMQGVIGTENAVKSKTRKTLYLLHGLSDNHTTWMRMTSIERYAQEQGLCVVMPFADKSFYCDMKYGGKYYMYIAKELPKLMESFFGLSSKREDRFLAGNSMGGYGALKIALRESDSFSAVAALSAVSDIVGEKEMFRDEFRSVFGDELEIPESEDLFVLAKRAEKTRQKPRVLMRVGTEDFLYDSNVKLRDFFQTLSFDYTYQETQGKHDWCFWEESIPYVMEWLLNAER